MMKSISPEGMKTDNMPITYPENVMKRTGGILFFIYFFIFAVSMPCFSQSEGAPLIDTTAKIKELREKEKNLNIREADLNAKEARLNAIEQDLLARESDIKKIRDEVSAKLEELKGKQDKELDNLVKVYSTTKPKAAANIIMTMDLGTALVIFKKMTPNVAGKILNEIGKINPEYASKMAETLTYQPKFGDKQ